MSELPITNKDYEKEVLMLDLHGRAETKLTVNVFVNDVSEYAYSTKSVSENEKTASEIFSKI